MTSDQLVQRARLYGNRTTQNARRAARMIGLRAKSRNGGFQLLENNKILFGFMYELTPEDVLAICKLYKPMKSQFTFVTFADLNTGDRFYLIPELLNLKKTLCIKVGPNVYLDAKRDKHTLLQVDTHVYGPLLEAPK